LDDYERHRISLNTAAALIRRKADFGSELKDQSEQLAGILVSLQDNLEIPNFHDLRLQAMISILVAQPARIGPYYAMTFFSGDYSLAQRASVLTAMGLGARELAGFSRPSSNEHESMLFTRLPDRLYKLYSGSVEMNAVTVSMSDMMMQPIATKKRVKLIRNDLGRIVAEHFIYPLIGRWKTIAQTR